jgi:hypothetical protein
MLGDVQNRDLEECKRSGSKRWFVDRGDVLSRRPFALELRTQILFQKRIRYLAGC